MDRSRIRLHIWLVRTFTIITKYHMQTNIAIVDAGIRRVCAQLERVYADASTVYVFTADHGMTDWGAHGAGTAHETHTPVCMCRVCSRFAQLPVGRVGCWHGIG
jgi:hypothetical protein